MGLPAVVFALRTTFDDFVWEWKCMLFSSTGNLAAIDRRTLLLEVTHDLVNLRTVACDCCQVFGSSTKFTLSSRRARAMSLNRHDCTCKYSLDVHERIRILI